jgi:hypothetical protein
MHRGIIRPFNSENSAPSPATLCVTLVFLLLTSPAGADSIRFCETFTDFARLEYEGVKYCDQSEKWGKLRVAGFVEWDQEMNVSQINSNAFFYVGVGWPDGDWCEYWAYFEEDPKWRPGKKSAFFPVGYWDDWEEKFVRTGKLCVRWNAKGFRFVLSGSTDSWDGVLEPILPPSLTGEPGPLTDRVEVQVVFADEWSDDQWWWEKITPLDMSGSVTREYFHCDDTDFDPIWVTLKGKTPATE